MIIRFLIFFAIVMSCFATSSRAATKQEIEEAIKRGVEALKRSQQADGTWREYRGTGATALAGLALLESGLVKASDPAVKKTAGYLHGNENETNTYSLALMIFFFDRLGDSGSQSLIKTLGERLRDGQLDNGCWTYNCNPQPQAQATLKRSGSKQRGAKAPALGKLGGLMMGGGDNSNAQFGLMGLWVARRHKVNVTDALAKTDDYFRKQQTDDGGWAYAGGVGGSRATGAMTCAGLLGLLVHQGNQAMLRAGTVADLKKGPTKGRLSAALDDAAVQKGLACLEPFISGTSAGQRSMGGDLYFWWSVERVGVAYGLKHIGQTDWYDEGSKHLLAKQDKDGSWRDFAPCVGTSFAILFLKRANLARDLTGLVTGQTDDAGGGAVRSGIGAEGLRDLAERVGARAGPLTAGEIGTATPGRLLAGLADADDKLRSAILKELRDRKGVEATLALAKAVGRLDGDARFAARKLLAQRLERMTPATLGKYLETDEVELQRAGAQAAGVKKAEALTGKLIELLSAANAEVADAAQEALVNIAGQQFGRFQGAKTAERFVIVKRWQAWWKQQSSAPSGE